ncbi:MAG: 2-(1,2-epoxy,2-dihydrophenyl)acetyl-CoA isomerase, partial [Pseudonocardiales bacterium]|nr:2-(1,2-epoxy,2-dihydrophenyl)acetyl-CoA isomerase [Pseudonocardiales bacterium]
MLDRHVRYRCDGGIARATLDRPDVMNALTGEVFADLFDVVRAANDDPDVRVLVITGAGP